MRGWPRAQRRVDVSSGSAAGCFLTSRVSSVLTVRARRCESCVERGGKQAGCGGGAHPRAAAATRRRASRATRSRRRSAPEGMIGRVPWVSRGCRVGAQTLTPAAAHQAGPGRADGCGGCGPGEEARRSGPGAGVRGRSPHRRPRTPTQIVRRQLRSRRGRQQGKRHKSAFTLSPAAGRDWRTGLGLRG